MTHREATALIDHATLRNLAHGANSGAPSSISAGAPSPQHWADLGCGAGTFTLALAEYLSPGSTIDALDLRPEIPQQTTPNAVTILPRKSDFVKADFLTTILPRAADFVTADFAPSGPRTDKFDGILMANSLHYVADQPRFIQKLHAALQPGGLFILVEYDTDTAVSRWVPYPLSFVTAARLFGPPHWSPMQPIGRKKSAFGRSNLYSGITIRLGA